MVSCNYWNIHDTTLHKTRVESLIMISRAEYQRRYVRGISFFQTIMPYSVLIENIYYNRKTGNVSVYSKFWISKKRKKHE